MPENEIFEINEKNTNEPEAPPIKKERKKRAPLTDEQKEQLKERLKQGRIKAREAREAKKKELSNNKPIEEVIIDDEPEKLETIKEEDPVVEAEVKKEVKKQVIIANTKTKKKQQSKEELDSLIDARVEAKLQKMILKEQAKLREKKEKVKVTHSDGKDPFKKENFNNVKPKVISDKKEEVVKKKPYIAYGKKKFNW